jgi:hypothetical protein
LGKVLNKSYQKKLGRKKEVHVAVFLFKPDVVIVSETKETNGEHISSAWMNTVDDYSPRTNL